MKVKEAITLFQYYRRSSHKKRTTASYLHLLKKFESLYGERPFDSMEADKIYLLGTLTEGLAKSSRRLRYAQLKAFYNFIITRCSLNELPYEKRREAERALNHAFGSKDFRDLFDRDREIKADEILRILKEELLKLQKKRVEPKDNFLNLRIPSIDPIDMQVLLGDCSA